MDFYLGVLGLLFIVSLVAMFVVIGKQDRIAEKRQLRMMTRLLNAIEQIAVNTDKTANR